MNPAGRRYSKNVTSGDGYTANLGQIIWLVGSIAVLVFAIMGAIKAFQGQWYEMPIVYNFVKQYV